MRTRWAVLAVVLAGAGTPAWAEKEFCPDRPGKSDPACTVDPGHVQLETSFADWSHERDSGETEDTILFNDALVRIGVGDSTELRLGWTSLGTDRTRDRQSGSVEHRTGTGDVSLGLRQNLRDGGDSGPSFSLEPFVTLPAGRTPIGAGTWGAALEGAAQLPLARDWSLTLNPEIAAAPDEDGDGRHLNYSLVANVSWNVTDAFQLGGEAYVERDRDPEDHATLASLDATAAYRIGENSQVDVGAYAGLNSATPRMQLVLGVAHRF